MTELGCKIKKTFLILKDNPVGAGHGIFGLLWVSLWVIITFQRRNTMNILEELTGPQKTFKVLEDGTETVEYRAPTSLMLRAASIIQQLDKAVQVLQLELHNVRKGVQE